MTRPASVLALFLSLFGLLPWVHAETELARKLARENQNLVELRRRLDSLQSKIQSLSSQRSQIRQEMSSHRQELSELETKIHDLRAKAGSAQAKVAKATQAFQKADQIYQHYQTNFLARLGHLYRRSRLSPLGVLFQSRSFADFVRTERYLMFLRKDAGRMHELETARKGYEERAESLRQAQIEEKRLQSQLIDRETELIASLERNKTLDSKLTRQEGIERLQAKKLKSAEDHLESRIRNLQKASRVEAGTRNLPRASPQRGTLLWPLAGNPRVLRRFGKSVNQAGTPEQNSGIDLSVPSSSQVFAVAAGKVAFEGVIPQPFGRTVMIDHGGAPRNLISIYGNLESILVGTGQEIRAGQTIGMVGSHLGPDSRRRFHFEIRQGETPQNPLLWLKKR